MKSLARFIFRPHNNNRSSPDQQQQRRLRQAGPHLSLEIEQPFTFGVFERAGRHDSRKKKLSEDRVIVQKLDGNLMLFGVLDGHAGSCCVEYLHEALPRVLLERLSVNNNNKQQALKEAFSICSKEWDLGPKTIERRQAGAVVLLCLVEGSTCYIANAGDCRAFASTAAKGEKEEEGKKIQIRLVNKIHRAYDRQEWERVEALGGHIVLLRGIPRVQGSLMPTRTFGDLNVRANFEGEFADFLNPEPDLYEIEQERSDEHGMRFLLLTSDGLADQFEENKIAQWINEKLVQGATADAVAKYVGEKAKECFDDLSIVLLVWK